MAISRLFIPVRDRRETNHPSREYRFSAAAWRLSRVVRTECIVERLNNHLLLCATRQSRGGRDFDALLRQAIKARGSCVGTRRRLVFFTMPPHQPPTRSLTGRHNLLHSRKLVYVASVPPRKLSFFDLAFGPGTVLRKIWPAIRTVLFCIF